MKLKHIEEIRQEQRMKQFAENMVYVTAYALITIVGGITLAGMALPV